MEQTLVYPAKHPSDDSITTIDQPECKELIIDIPLALEASRSPDQYSIYRVPKRLRKLNNMAYTPQLVSIGPFHHRSEELKDMDIHKFLNLRNFCYRTGKSIEHLKCIIRAKEMEIRSCYSETFLLSSEGFVNMILLDAIFILELFRRKYEKDFESAKASHEEDFGNSKTYEKESGKSKAHYQIDYILSRSCMESSIQRDLLLLENQLPFFILEELYCNAELNVRHQNGEAKTLFRRSCGFFGDLIYINDWKPKSKMCGQAKPKSSSEKRKQDFIDKLVKYFYPDDQQNRSSPKPKKEVKHFTDLVRYFFCPPWQTESQESKPKCCNKNKRTKHLYGTATKFDEAGLKFTRPDSDTDLLQIQFRKNWCLHKFPCFNLAWLLSCLPCLKKTCLVDMQRFLDVPTLWIDDKTECLFRNLMALEQCHYQDETDICDYIVLLDDLITTKDDVRLLVDKKIIINELGSSKAVTGLVNHLALEIQESGNRYECLCKELNEYYESTWNRLVGTLTRVYFSDFFKGTATIVGILVLGFTIWNFSWLLRDRL